ncbi:GNAT family N-acetyltransferase [Endozoicomonas sp. OPT23]|uniref:GNAT family N-acetyltransferase n=1 Tax=Endozoicomonas sp. OPT23 TaxID=2072845 RepID=UPI0018917FFF|nr:GNAT family N-acetyltransferase [Endozoicomonas sp. OPT23]
MNLKITKDVSLERLQVADAGVFFDLIEMNRALLSKYLYWVDDVTNLSSAEQYIENRINSSLPESRWYKILFKESVSGVFGIKSVCRESSEAEIGYWLSEHAHGHGVIAKITMEVCNLLANEGVQSLKITCLEENQASITVAKRLGAVHTDTLSGYMEMAGRLQDLHIYTLKL